MVDLRCKNCNRVLAKASIVVAAIKCPSCKMIFEYSLYETIYTTSTYTKEKDLNLKKDSDTINAEPQSS